MSKKKTVGEYSYEMQMRDNSNEKIDVVEMQREMHKGSASDKSYEEEVWDTVDRGRKDATVDGNFYLVVLTKRERHLKNVVRNLFFYRQTIPRPEFDQTVYKYHRNDDEIEYIWTVPNNSTCHYLPTIQQDLPEEQMRLVHMIEAFMCGDMDKYADKLELKDLKEKKLVK